MNMLSPIELRKRYNKFGFSMKGNSRILNSLRPTTPKSTPTPAPEALGIPKPVVNEGTPALAQALAAISAEVQALEPTLEPKESERKAARKRAKAKPIELKAPGRPKGSLSKRKPGRPTDEARKRRARKLAKQTPTDGN